MKDFNELTENELLDINGGGWFEKVVKYGDLVYDFTTGLFKGFSETAKKLPR
jgi:hypothetical protein